MDVKHFFSVHLQQDNNTDEYPLWTILKRETYFLLLSGLFIDPLSFLKSLDSTGQMEHLNAYSNMLCLYCFGATRERYHRSLRVIMIYREKPVCSTVISDICFQGHNHFELLLI